MKVFSIEEYLFISLLCQLSQKKYSYLSPDNSLYLHNVINILHPHFVVGLRKLCILYSILKFIYFSKKKIQSLNNSLELPMVLQVNIIN